MKSIKYECIQHWLSSDKVSKIKTECANRANSNSSQRIVILIEVMAEHVHLFVKAKPSAAPHWIVQQLKGCRSRLLWQEYPELKSKLPALWTRSYYCENVGHISETSIGKTIDDQKDQ